MIYFLMIKKYILPSLALKKFKLRKSDVRYARVYLLHLFSMLTIFIFLLTFPLGFILDISISERITNLIGLFLSIMIYVSLHYKIDQELAANILIVLVPLTTLVNLCIDKNEHFSLLATLIFPIIAVFFKGFKTGLILSILHMIIVLAIIFWGLTNFTPTFTMEAFTYYIFVSSVVVFLVSFYESSRNTTQGALHVALIELDTYKNDLEKKVALAINEAKFQERMLIQQSKMAQTGDMLASISHQWKQPLAGISAVVTNVELTIALNILNEKELESSMKNISQQVNYMHQTINDFTNFLKPSHTKEHFDVKDCIAAILPIISPQLLTHQIAFTTSFENEKFSIFGSKNEFAQVLLNIINNATDAIYNMKVKGIIHIKVEDKDDTVQISVEDNGGGIALDIIDTVFQPYVTTKSDTNGTGIGLHMVKTIVENHMDGKITVKNTPLGACFTFNLKKS